MNWKAALALIALLTLAIGCGAPSVGAADPKKPKSYSNVVSLSPSTSEYIGMLGAGRFLTGRTSSCDRPEGMENVEIVVSGTSPDYEAITAIEPDLIMYDKALYSDDEIAKINQLGFETMEYDVETIDDYADFGYRVGAKLSIEMDMSRYLDKVYRAVAAAVVHQTTKPRTTLLLGDGKEGNYLMMGKSGFHSQLFSTCGATPVGVEGKMFQEANIERLIDMDPEIIYSDGNAQSIYADARLQAVAAVKNQRVYDFDAKDIVRIGASLDTIIERIGEDVYRMPINPRTGAKQ